MHAIPLKAFWTTTELQPGQYRHARKFGAPRVKDEPVWLTGTATGIGTVMINGETAGEIIAGPFAVEITTLLKPRNEVWIDLDSSDAPNSVHIEIRERL